MSGDEFRELRRAMGLSQDELSNMITLASVACGPAKMAKSLYRRLPSFRCVILSKKTERRKPANGLQGEGESSWPPSIQVVLGWSRVVGRNWKDTLKNRFKAEADALRISEEMERGEFNYLKWFPEGNKADEFRPKSEAQADDKSLTVGEYYRDRAPETALCASGASP